MPPCAPGASHTPDCGARWALHVRLAPNLSCSGQPAHSKNGRAGEGGSTRAPSGGKIGAPPWAWQPPGLLPWPAPPGRHPPSCAGQLGCVQVSTVAAGPTPGVAEHWVPRAAAGGPNQTPGSHCGARAASSSSPLRPFGYLLLRRGPPGAIVRHTGSGQPRWAPQSLARDPLSLLHPWLAPGERVGVGSGGRAGACLAARLPCAGLGWMLPLDCTACERDAPPRLPHAPPAAARAPGRICPMGAHGAPGPPVLTAKLRAARGLQHVLHATNPRDTSSAAPSSARVGAAQPPQHVGGRGPLGRVR